MASHVLYRWRYTIECLERRVKIQSEGCLLTNAVWVRNDSGTFYIGYHTFSRQNKTAVIRRQ